MKAVHRNALRRAAGECARAYGLTGDPARTLRALAEALWKVQRAPEDRALAEAAAAVMVRLCEQCGRRAEEIGLDLNGRVRAVNDRAQALAVGRKG